MKSLFSLVGVALGNGIGKMIGSELGAEVIVPDYPQLNGAIGCAVHAREKEGIVCS